LRIECERAQDRSLRSPGQIRAKLYRFQLHADLLHFV
jgi:hypothetical protein